MRPHDQTMLVAIGSEVDILAPLSSDRAAQYSALARLERFGTTGLHDAVIRTVDAIQAARGRRALVLLSDGDDRYSTASAADALGHARRSDVMIFPVALGARRPPLFAELARSPGAARTTRRTRCPSRQPCARLHESCASSTSSATPLRVRWKPGPASGAASG